MKTLSEIFREERVELREGQDTYYCVCPQCSHTRRAHNRKKPVLKVRIDGRGVRFGCMHCDYHVARFYDEGTPSGRAQRDARSRTSGAQKNIKPNGGKAWDRVAGVGARVPVPPSRRVVIHQASGPAKEILDRTAGRKVVAVERGLLPGFTFDWRNAYHH